MSAVAVRVFRGLAVAILALMLVQVVVVAPAGAANGRRLLITGDSVTQGSAGDYTWRFRLWQKLRTTAPGTTFVGPRTSVYDVVNGRQGSPFYAASFPAKAHGALWGDSYAAELSRIGRTVGRTHPGVLVSMLGADDLAVRSSPSRTAAHVQSYIARARAASPGLDVVLGEPLDRYDPWSKKYLLTAEVTDFARRLKVLAARLDTKSQRVVVAPTHRGWDAAADTWDGTHPNPTGEALIAQRISEGLARVGVGRPGPDVARRRAWAVAGPRPRAVGGSEKLGLGWSRASTGATAMYVEQHLVAGGTSWQRLPYPVAGAGWTVGGLVAGGTYASRLVPVKGTSTGIHGPVGTAHVTGPVPGAVRYVKAQPGGDALPDREAATTRWSESANATGYVLSEGLVSDAGTQWHELPYPTASRSWVFPGLMHGLHYRFRVRGARGFLRGDAGASMQHRMHGLPVAFVQSALGDSYSAGLGSRKAKNVGRRCMRNAGSWVFQVDAGARRGMNLLACAGARVPRVSQQVVAMRKYFAAHPRSPKLVTLTVGGNDVGFVDELKHCILGRCAGDESAVATRIASLSKTLRGLYRKIRATEPLADVLVGGYPEVVDQRNDSGNVACHGISDQEQAVISSLASRLNARIEADARASSVWGVGQRVRDRFHGHNACAGDSENWINTLSLNLSGATAPVSPLSFHPNDKGQHAYARAFADAWKAFTR